MTREAWRIWRLVAVSCKIARISVCPLPFANLVPKGHLLLSLFWFVWCGFSLILAALSLVGGQSVYAVGLSSKSSFISFILVFCNVMSKINRESVLLYFLFLVFLKSQKAHKRLTDCVRYTARQPFQSALSRSFGIYHWIRQPNAPNPE